MLAQLTLYFQHCLSSQRAATNTAGSIDGISTVSPVAHRLPTELILHVIQLAANAKTVEGSLDPQSAYPLARAKPDFASLSGLNGSCRAYHTAVQKFWYSVLYIRTQADWEMVDRLGISVYVREIRVAADALGENLKHDAFMQFHNLHTAFLDVHNDFVLTPPSPTERDISRPIGRYHNVAPCLPSSLRRLWITNAHGPDIAVIQTLIACCPELVELSISRCTMFSPRFRPDGDSSGVGCKFWDRFPDDHDSYFAGEGIEDYASSLAQELKQLSNLEMLHMGLYLTPHEAISEHLHGHGRLKAPASPSWDIPCEACASEFKSQTQIAEGAASRILFGAMPGLRKVSWASFFSDNRLGAIEYTNNFDRSGSGERQATPRV